MGYSDFDHGEDFDDDPPEATAKQVNFIHSLCRDGNLDEDAVIHDATGEWLTRNELDVRQASEVIDSILNS